MLKFYFTDRDVSDISDINVRIIKPSDKELCKKKKQMDRVTLVCVAENFYPDHVSITWMVAGVERKDGVATDPSAKQDKVTKMFSISSRLKVTKKEWNNEKNEFSCKLNFYNGSKTEPIFNK